MSIASPLRKADRRRELPAARIEDNVYQSTVKDEQLHKLIEAFNIPNEIKFYLPTPYFRLSQPPEVWVAVCLDTFDVGLRLPLCGFYKRMLNALDMAPLQLNPNVY